jgi:hypothetical protein
MQIYGHPGEVLRTVDFRPAVGTASHMESLSLFVSFKKYIYKCYIENNLNTKIVLQILYTNLFKQKVLHI